MAVSLRCLANRMNKDHQLRYSDFENRIDIDAFEEAIGFEPIETRSGNDVGHCPDWQGLHSHGDTTGKFAIHRDKKVYNCWVCGGGSILSLAMEINDMDMQEATDWLFKFTETADQTSDDFSAVIMTAFTP